jgi:hypothetical protein
MISIISVIVLVVGLLGMLGLWALAWQLWIRALEVEEAPTIRARPISDANTAFFVRDDIATVVESEVEKTEILQDGDPSATPALRTEKLPLADPVPTVSTRKTTVFAGPPPPGAH